LGESCGPAKGAFSSLQIGSLWSLGINPSPRPVKSWIERTPSTITSAGSFFVGQAQAQEGQSSPNLLPRLT
jgi:hypothetical protein